MIRFFRDHLRKEEGRPDGRPSKKNKPKEAYYFFLATAFLTAFLTAGFLAATFLTAFLTTFLTAFLATGFLAATFLTAFLTAGFLAAGFFTAGFFVAIVLYSLFEVVIYRDQCGSPTHFPNHKFILERDSLSCQNIITKEGPGDPEPSLLFVMTVAMMSRANTCSDHCCSGVMTVGAMVSACSCL